MNVRKLVQTGLMIALALVFQIGFASFAQSVVGPLVNLVLFVSVMMIGPLAGVTVGVITPLVAFLVGIMPLAPLVPVIMIGNALLVVVFHFSKQTIKFGEYIGVVLAALFKFIFLATAVRQLLPLVMPKVPPKIIAAMGINQFITALVGGVIALVVAKALQAALKGRSQN